MVTIDSPRVLAGLRIVSALTICLSAVAQTDIRVPVTSLPTLSPGDTLDLETGRKGAALLRSAALKPIPYPGATSKPAHAAQIVIQRIAETSKLLEASGVSASASARMFGCRANFSMQSQGAMRIRRTSQYVMASATWSSAPLNMDRDAIKLVEKPNMDQLGSKVVVGMLFGGELHIVFELMNSSESVAEKFAANLNASGFGVKADVKVAQVAEQSGQLDSLAIHFFQNGGPEFIQPSYERISQQVFDWANKVSIAPMPMYYLVADTAVYVDGETAAKAKARAEKLRLFAHEAEKAVATMERAIVDRATLNDVAAMPQLYEDKSWKIWYQGHYASDLASIEKSYSDAYRAAIDLQAYIANDMLGAIPAASPHNSNMRPLPDRITQLVRPAAFMPAEAVWDYNENTISSKAGGIRRLGHAELTQNFPAGPILVQGRMMVFSHGDSGATDGNHWLVVNGKQVQGIPMHAPLYSAQAGLERDTFFFVYNNPAPGQLTFKLETSISSENAAMKIGQVQMLVVPLGR